MIAFTDVPLQNPDVELFTDGSSYLHERIWVSGVAVVSLHKTVSASSLPLHYNAQAAELFALKKACEATAGQSTNIYNKLRLEYAIQQRLYGSNGTS